MTFLLHKSYTLPTDVEIDDKRNNDSRNNSNIFRLSPCQTIVTTCVRLKQSIEGKLWKGFGKVVGSLRKKAKR